jgi:hypothetical protein
MSAMLADTRVRALTIGLVLTALTAVSVYYAGWLLTLKVGGGALTAVLGVLGVAVDFRTADKTSLTVWGRLNILGILISATVASAATILDDANAKRDQSEQLARNNDMLQSLSHLVSPVTTAEVTFTVDLPSADPRVRPYAQRLRGLLQSSSPPALSDVQVINFVNRGKIAYVRQASDAFPGFANDEEVLNTSSTTVGLTLDFFKQPRAPEVIAAPHWTPGSDMEVLVDNYPQGMSLDNLFAPMVDPEHNPFVNLAYEEGNGGMSLRTLPRRMNALPSFANSGGILGVSDLLGGEFVACLETHPLNDHEADSDALDRQMTLESVRFRLDSGFTFAIKPASPTDRFVRYSNDVRYCRETALARRLRQAPCDHGSCRGRPSLARVLPSRPGEA